METDTVTSTETHSTTNLQESVEDLSETCSNDIPQESVAGFKKPAQLGPKHGKIEKVRGLNDTSQLANVLVPKDIEIQQENSIESESDVTDEPDIHTQCVLSTTKSIPLPYTEPAWGGIPEKEYKFEVLKSGVILETIDLSKHSFHIVGRLPSCNISLAHPTISRYHAILQYRVVDDEKNSAGLYLYDLGSTHGTFWNGSRVRPNMYVRIRAGHMIRFGCSQRKFILQAPPEDAEEECELTVTELKEKRMLELKERERIEQERLLQEEETRLKKEEEENAGIDWGMGEDADEETDLTENPYASTADEELFLDDPKKTLRGWFEREGYDLQYQTEEKGIGQFLCWVDLPIENITGHSVRAEALVKGKKKESVIQCALEACRILDRHGLLRQATHEARKRKTRNWEEEDYYDSDEDNFLDRTGTVEKKREQRMRLAGKLEPKVETYSSLLEKHTEVVRQIARLEECLENSKKAMEADADGNNEDALDAFMSTLSASVLSKSDMIKMKLELQELRKKEVKLTELVNLARPANLPPLATNPVTKGKDNSQIASDPAQRLLSNISHKRKHQAPKLKTEKSSTNPSGTQVSSSDSLECEEMESEDDTDVENADKSNKDDKHTSTEDNIDQDKSKATIRPRNKDSRCETSVSPDLPKSSDTHLKKAEKNRIEDSNKKLKEDLKQKQHTKKAKKSSKAVENMPEMETYREDYSTWVPPQDQTGDGKTSLNEKYGY